MLRALPLALAITVALAAPAQAQFVPEPAFCFGHARKDVDADVSSFDPAPPATDAAGNVYANEAVALGVGLSSTALASTWGDRVTTTSAGTLLEQDFTVFNSPSSAGALVSASFRVTLYDAATLAFLGGYTTGTVTFGAGLPPGAYAFVTASGLASRHIVLPTTDLLVLQQVAVATGAATRLGVVFYDPPNVGASAPSMWIDSPTFGPAGYYTVGGLHANLGARLLADLPVPARVTTWGAVKARYFEKSR